MSSNIRCSADVIPVFKALKDKQLHKYIILKFNQPKDPTEVIIDVIGDKDATFEDMKAQLPRNEIRYFVYDAKYNLKSGGERKKVALVAWSDDEQAPMRQKMLVSSTSDNIKSALTGFAKFMTINDYEELTEEYITENVSDNYSK